MAAHHHADVHTRQSGVVEIGARECLGDETGRGGEARRVVVADEVVVDGFRDVDGAQRIIGLLRLLADDAHRIGGIVAADIEKAADFMRAQHFENLLAILGVWLVARRAQCRRRRGRNHFKIAARFLRQVEQVFVDDAAHAMLGAVNASDAGKFAGFEHNANKRLVDDRGWAATLGDQNFCRRHETPFRILIIAVSPSSQCRCQRQQRPLPFMPKWKRRNKQSSCVAFRKYAPISRQHRACWARLPHGGVPRRTHHCDRRPRQKPPRPHRRSGALTSRRHPGLRAWHRHPVRRYFPAQSSPHFEQERRANRIAILWRGTTGKGHR